jgi:hypothetical protein
VDWYVTLRWKVRNAHKIIDENRKRKKPIGRTIHRWDVRETGSEVVRWIQWVQWQSAANAVIDLQVIRRCIIISGLGFSPGWHTVKFVVVEVTLTQVSLRVSSVSLAI